MYVRYNGPKRSVDTQAILKNAFQAKYKKKNFADTCQMHWNIFI